MPPPPAVADAASYPAAARASVSVRPEVRLPGLADETLRGIGLILLSTIFFSSSDILAKHMTETMPPLQVTWMRYIVFLVIALPMAWRALGSRAMHTTRPLLQVLRGLGVAGSSIFFILGITSLQVADATAIGFVAPIFITALSIPLLGEKVGLRRWLAAMVGLVGVLIIVRPGTGTFQMAALLPVCSAAVWAFSAVATRLMSRTERPETTFAWTAIVGLVALSAVMPFIWVTPGWEWIALGTVMGLLSTAGHYVIVLAYRRAPASVLAPFTYTQLIWATGLGFLAFGVVPGVTTYVGAAFIAASGLYTAHRERVKAKEARAAARA
jgi:drug/metabolite transporter (DMT)-like permease